MKPWVRVAGGSLPCEHYLLAPLTGNKEGSKGLMVLRGKPAPNRFPTSLLCILMENTLLLSISSVCHPWGPAMRSHISVPPKKGYTHRRQHAVNAIVNAPLVKSFKVPLDASWRSLTPKVSLLPTPPLPATYSLCPFGYA